MAVWKFIAVGTVTTVTTNNITLTEPAGVRQGDLLVACISHRAAVATNFTLPAGWTLVDQSTTANSLTNANAVASGVMAFTVRGASAPSYAFTRASGADQAIGRVAAYRNSAQSSVLDVNAARVTAVSTTAVSVTGVTTTVAGDLLVVAMCGGQEATWSSIAATTPSGASSATDFADPSTTSWKERSDDAFTTGTDGSLGIFDAIKVTAGATGNITGTASIAASHVVLIGAFKIVNDSAIVNANEFESLQFSNDASGLTGVGQNKQLEPASGASSGTWSGQAIAAAAVAYGSWFTNAGIPDTAGDITVSTGVRIAVSTGNSNLQLGVALVRVNSSGVIQAISPEKDFGVISSAGWYSQEVTPTGLGTWASGDRLEVRLALYNISASAGQSCTIVLGEQANVADTGYSSVRVGMTGRPMEFAYGEKSNCVALSGSELVATRGSAEAGTVYGTVGGNHRQFSNAALKFHCEFTIGQVTGVEATAIGLATLATTLWDSVQSSGCWLGMDANSIGCYNDGVTYRAGVDTTVAGQSFQAGDVVALAYDTVGSTVQWNRRRSGANTGWSTAQSTTGLGSTMLFAAATLNGSADVITVNFNGPFVITPQSGYVKWDGTSAAGTDHLITATFAGAGSLTANLAKDKTVSASFAGAGALTANALVNRLVTASFAGAGALTANVTVVTPSVNHTITANFAGVGSLTANLAKDKTVSANFDGVGTLTAQLRQGMRVTASFAGAGLIDDSDVTVTTPAPNHLITAAFAGAGSLTANALVNRRVAATFAGAGALVAEVDLNHRVNASFAGAGALTGDVRVNKNVVANFAGAGALVAELDLGMRVTASFQGAGLIDTAVITITDTVTDWPISATFAGVGGLTANVQVDRIVTAAFAGAGALTGNVQVNRTVTAAFAGVGSLTANLAKDKTVSANFAGTGALISALSIVQRITASFAGVGALTADLAKDKTVTANFAGVGALAAQLSVNHTVTASFAGVGFLVGAVTVDHVANDWPVTATFEGVGSLSAVLRQGVAVTSSFAGAGALTANVQVDRRISASFVGAGALNAQLRQGMIVSAAFAGSGGLSATIVQGMRVNASFAGSGRLVGDVTIPSQRMFRARLGAVGEFALGQWSVKPVPSVNHLILSSFAGVGNLTADVRVNKSVSASLAGAGALTATLSQGVRVNAAFQGVGTLSAVVDVIHPAGNDWTIQANFAGAGSLTAILRQGVSVNANFVGAGSLTASVTRGLLVTANFAGLGTLAASLVAIDKKITANFAGVGALSGSVTIARGVVYRARIGAVGELALGQWSVKPVQYAPVNHLITAAFAGAGTLAATLRQGIRVQANFAGLGNLVSDIIVQTPGTPTNWLITAAFAGQGGLSAQLRQGMRVSGQFQGRGEIDTSFVDVIPPAGTGQDSFFLMM